VHLNAELPKFKPEIFQQFKMVDIHAKTRFFDTTLTPAVDVRGTADIVIVASNCATDNSSLASGTLVVFELKTSGDLASHNTQLTVELLAARMSSNKPVLAILTDLATGAIALRVRLNEIDNSFYLERTELNMSQMATMLVQFLDPCFADVTRGFDDHSTNINERATSMFLKSRRVGMADIQDQIDMFHDLMQNPEELEVEFRQQATANLLRSFGYESILLSIDQAERSREREDHASRGDSFKSMYT
jgi:hypothetical protein